MKSLLITAHAQQVQNACNSKTDAKKAEQYEKNASLVGAKAFSKYLCVIMSRATFEKKNILDCVVTIDLCKAPPTVGAKLAKDFLSNARLNCPEDHDHLKRIIDRNIACGSLNCSCRSVDVDADADDNPATAVLVKAIPRETAPGGSWSQFQKQLKESVPKDFEIYYKSKDYREDFFEEMWR